MTKKPDWVVPALIVIAVALLVRVVAIAEVSGALYHKQLVLDAATYNRIALTGDPRTAYWQPPLYPWLLRGIYALTGGSSPVAVRVLQALLGAALAGLVFDIARRLTTRPFALAAGLAVALAGPLVNADLELLPGSLAAFLVALWTWLLFVPRCRPARNVALGLVLGAMGLLVPTLAAAGALGLLWLKGRDGWRPALVAGLIATLPVAAVTIRNYAKDGDVVPVSYNGGVNLFIGNNPQYPATVGIRPGIEWTHLVDRPRCEGGAATAGQESSWFAGRALAFAADQPLVFARNILWKTAATFTREEIGRNRDEYAVRGESRLMWLLMWPFGFPALLLLPAAAIGTSALLRSREKDLSRAGRLFLFVAAGVLVSSIVFFPTGRYRVPAWPALVLLAAVGLPHARRKDLVAGGVVLALAFVPHGIPRIPASETFYEIAVDLDQDGHTSASIPYYERALALAPDNADAHLSLGLALGKLDRDQEGRVHLERATQLIPDADNAYQGLAVFWRKAGDPAKTREVLEAAVRINPCNRRALAMLSHVLMDAGDLEGARKRLDEARSRYRRRDPDVERALARLATLTTGGR